MTKTLTLSRRPEEMPPHPPYRHVRRGRRPMAIHDLIDREGANRRHYFGDPWPRCEPPCPECP